MEKTELIEKLSEEQDFENFIKSLGQYLEEHGPGDWILEEALKNYKDCNGYLERELKLPEGFLPPFGWEAVEGVWVDSAEIALVCHFRGNLWKTEGRYSSWGAGTGLGDEWYEVEPRTKEIIEYKAKNPESVDDFKKWLEIKEKIDAAEEAGTYSWLQFSRVLMGYEEAKEAEEVLDRSISDFCEDQDLAEDCGTKLSNFYTAKINGILVRYEQGYDSWDCGGFAGKEYIIPVRVVSRVVEEFEEITG